MPVMDGAVEEDVMPEPHVAGQGPRDQVSAPPPPEGGSLIDASADLVDATVQYLRQEAEALVREKAVEPIQRAGVSAGLALAIALIAALGLGFVATGLLILLASFLGWPITLFIVGGGLLLTAAAVAFVRSKKVSR